MKTKLFVSSSLMVALAGSCKEDDNNQPVTLNTDTEGDMFSLRQQQ
jgi:hypothetical protein